MMLLIATCSAIGGYEEPIWPMPVFDRWNYAFNTSPGTRGVASTFSAWGSPYDFDNRDGQLLLGYMTDDQVTPGLPASSYQLMSCQVQLAISSDDLVYDATVDDWSTHHTDGPADADAGRPTVLSGVAFRNGWNGWDFGETGAFGEAMGHGVRNCYPVDFDDNGDIRDISNNLAEAFNPNVWAVGTTDVVAPGDVLPAYTPLSFDLDLSDPSIRCAVQQALADGLLEFMVTSLHPASEPGSGGENAYPDWILKENVLVDFGVAQAASLSLTLQVVPPSGVAGDANGDGLVDVEDLLSILESFGPCPCCMADFDGSGTVDVNDLLTTIAGWSN